MMNRSSSKDSLVGAGGRNYNNNTNHNAMTNGILPHRRGMSFTKNSSAENFNTSNNVDLFSRSRTSLPAASSDESDLQVRLARLSVGSAKPAKSILDDLLSSNEGGKNDYDWLLTPPGTPLVPSSEGKESQQPARVTTRSRSTVRSSSISKTSRLSVSQSESNNNNNNNNYPSRPARSSSVTRSSISTTQYTTNYSTRNTNILNTSSASVSSYIRPSTPTRTARPSTPSSTRTTPSRTSTPSRTRPTPTPTPSRPTQPTRPSTPTSRPQTPGNSTTTTTTPTIRPSSRSSTPTRRTLTPSLTPSTSSLTSGPRGVSNGPRSVGSGSRPSSPSPRVRPPPQPMNISDFSHETPPNLRTTLPDRPLSAGRSRPGASLKGNLDNSPNTTTGTITRRHSSPSVIRGRVHPEPSGRTRPSSNGHVVESLDPRRTSSHLPQSLTRKPVKPSNSENGSTGFGRNISKKSLDMAIKHMDIRNGGVRPLSGSTLFPQSIRSTNSRAHPPARGSSVDGGGSENGSYSNGYSWNRERGSGPGPGPMEDESPHSSYKLSSEVDIYESSRYDAILLKEDLKNTSWLHTADDKNDEGFLFDNGFESLPEPFSPL